MHAWPGVQGNSMQQRYPPADPCMWPMERAKSTEVTSILVFTCVEHKWIGVKGVHLQAIVLSQATVLSSLVSLTELALVELLAYTNINTSAFVPLSMGTCKRSQRCPSVYSLRC